MLHQNLKFSILRVFVGVANRLDLGDISHVAYKGLWFNHSSMSLKLEIRNFTFTSPTGLVHFMLLFVE